MSQVKRPRSKLSKDQFYVDPAVLKAQIKEFYVTDFCTKELGESITKIAKGLSHSRNFNEYSYLEEMVGDAIVKMYAALKQKKFNVDSLTSPFCYFTTIAFHAFINRIKKEKKHTEALNAYKESRYESLLTEGQVCDMDYHIYVKPNYDDEDSDFQ